MCQIWTDHQWAEPRFVESGKHHSMGRYNKFLVRCEHCQRETTETEWLDLPVTADIRTLAVEGKSYADR